METVILSAKSQVVIPESMRQALQLAPGQKLRVMAYAGRLEIIPVGAMAEIRGFLRGMATTLEREEDRL